MDLLRDGTIVWNALLHWPSTFLHGTYNYVVSQPTLHRVGGIMLDFRNVATMQGTQLPCLKREKSVEFVILRLFQICSRGG